MSPFDAKKAAARRAKKREREARGMFLDAKKHLEAQFLPAMTPGSTHVVTLLTPFHHLTSTNFAAFNKWVKAHPGWRARRFAATDKEKASFQAKNEGKR